jgi:hypothetical protein
VNTDLLSPPTADQTAITPGHDQSKFSCPKRAPSGQQISSGGGTPAPSPCTSKPALNWAFTWG